MLEAVFLLVISVGAVLAGRGHMAMAARMRDFATVEGTVIARDVRVTTCRGEAQFGESGDHEPHITYTYEVDGVTYTADRWAYGADSRSLAVARERAAAVPDRVTVHYDPADPQTAYLHTHGPRLGRMIMIGGWVGVGTALLVGVASLAG